MGFRNVDEPFCIDDGAERDGTPITLLPSLAFCSVSLLTLELDRCFFTYNASFVHLTEEEIAAFVPKVQELFSLTHQFYC
jgi:hypothetical protein